jgi:DUF1680 family protein
MQVTLTPVSATPDARPVAPGSGRLTPLSLSDVTITGGFWGRLQERNARATLPHLLHWLDRVGWLGNFDDVAAGRAGDHRRGREFTDSEVYKTLEAMAWQLSWAPDEDLELTFAAVVQRVAAAQAPDGYLNTNFDRPGLASRYTDLEWGHELYCYGHLLQAATARLRSGHDDLLVDVARRAANHVCREFGADARQGVCGHPEIEVAMAEFGRATGDRRYIDQAKLFLDRRGHHRLADIEWGRAYFQDDIPFREARSLRGHAVRATYLAAGAVDIAVETGDVELLAAAVAQQAHAMATRTYLTGGVGSQHQDEAFGPDFALPPDRAYSETCAGVGSIMLSWRLLLATGQIDYADLIERTLFNVVATSPATDGRSFFYTNTLHQRTPGVPVDPDRVVPRASSSLRAPWFEVTCCPPNVARTLASLAGYVAARDKDGVQLLQYLPCTIDTTLDDGRRVQLQVDTEYPAAGAVRIVNRSTASGPWTLTLRVPSWADGARLTDADGTRPVAPGSVSLTREWRDGDEVLLELPMAPRWVHPDPRIDAIRGCVAAERGPLVLCLESADLAGGEDIARISVDAATAPADLGWSDQPAPVARANGSELLVAQARWPYNGAAEPHDGRSIPVPLVPYFAWANRGPGTMRVWLPSAPV